MRLLTLFVIPVLAVMFFTSCKKDTNTNVPKSVTPDTTNNNVDTLSDSLNNAPVYTITHSGNLWVKESITFQTNAPGSNFSWSFGDNTTSNDATPSKMYSRVDTFIVTLIVDGDTINPIRDTLIIGCGYQQFEGNRTFFKTQTWHDNSLPGVIDTQFNGLTTEGIIPNNDTSFWFSGDLFEYAPQNNASFLKYTEKFWPYTTFMYFLANDSISYFGITPIDQGVTHGVIYDKMETQ